MPSPSTSWYRSNRPRRSTSSAVRTLPRAIGLSGYGNGSAIQLFIPRSRSLMTKTGVWNSSAPGKRSEEHTSELQSRLHLVCRLLLEKKKDEDRYRAHGT